MTTADRWARIKQLFEAALEREPAERSAFLDEQCAGDADLRHEVDALLSADNENDEFLQEPAVDLLGLGASGTDVAPGLRIGPYRVLREMGRGGMGVVYEAERADLQYRKRVAIKVIRRGMDSELILRRFRQERQILAALNHPNIAGLLDGGMTPDGQPYLVMEFVEGVPIHSYVTRHNLSLPDRIRLFREVCAAVHFAHQNLVVHRDLKPSNILVTEAGDVKLLDFGVAKMLRPDLELTVPVTEAGARVLTPAYASPEQIRGEQVTTATDVYSLGVILYEVLTGRPPFDFSDTSFQQVERMVCDAIPTRPSAAVAFDTTRPTDSPELRALRRMLIGELDNIVLMAMRKEPSRRYASAAALADDLGRYLGGLPVVALKDTALYRLRKFVQRQKYFAIAAAIGFLVLCGGIGATLWQARGANQARRIAEQRFVDLHSLTKTLVFDVHDALAEVPGATRTRELVVRRAFEYLDRLSQQGKGNDPLLRDVAEAYIRLGLVQGQPSGANRGDLTGAQAAFLRAIAIATDLVSRDSANLGFRRTLALGHEKLGDVEAWAGRVDSGVAHAREALAGFAAIALAQPDSARAQLSMVISTVKLADLLGNPSFPNLGDTSAALRHYETARARLERAPLAGRTDPATRRYVGLVQERLGSLLRLQRSWAGALDAFARSLAIREELSELDPGFNATRDVAVTLQNLCEVHQEIRSFPAALAHCRRAHDIFAQLRITDPHNLQSIDDLARIHASRSRVNAGLGRWTEAARELAEAVELRDSILIEHPANVRNQQMLTSALLDLVPYYTELVRLGGAGAALAARRGRAALERAEVMLQALAAKGLATAADRNRLRQSARILAGQ
jgi:non-specific serine/threonine protein kinase/serine/threonine-protein kinase